MDIADAASKFRELNILSNEEIDVIIENNINASFDKCDIKMLFTHSFWRNAKHVMTHYPAYTDTVLRSVDNQLDKENIQKPRLLLDLANAINDCVNEANLEKSTSFDGKVLKVSGKIGSDLQHAVMILTPDHIENSVSSIRCQDRTVFGKDGMQQRVIATYGKAGENTTGLKYFKEYANFLNIDPTRNEFVTAPAYKYI